MHNDETQTFSLGSGGYSAAGTFSVGQGSHDSYASNSTGDYHVVRADGGTESADYTIDYGSESHATSSDNGSFGQAPGSFTSSGTFQRSSSSKGHSDYNYSNGDYSNTSGPNAGSGTFAWTSHEDWDWLESQAGSFANSSSGSGRSRSSDGTFTSKDHGSANYEYNSRGTATYDSTFADWTLATTSKTKSAWHDKYDASGSFSESSSGGSTNGTFSVDFGESSENKKTQDGTFSVDDHREVRTGTLHTLKESKGGSSTARSGSFGTSVSGTYHETSDTHWRSEYKVTDGGFSPSPRGYGGNYMGGGRPSGTYTIDILKTTASDSDKTGSLGMTEGRLTMTGTFTANQSGGGHDNQAWTGSSSTGWFHWDQQNSASAATANQLRPSTCPIQNRSGPEHQW